MSSLNFDNTGPLVEFQSSILPIMVRFNGYTFNIIANRTKRKGFIYAFQSWFAFNLL